VESLKNNKKLIQDVVITPLNQIFDNRGAVFHVMKNNSIGYNGFGEAYFSRINENVTKGWKYHKKMTQNFSIPYGKLKLVLFDDRDLSVTKGVINEIILDDSKNYKRVTIPKNIWYSFKCISKDYCLLLNISNLTHDPNECKILDLNNKFISYKWN
tara:strand:+ start:295 stop:762 length:468 start_codon:yes stop_codon:yes gene_type:complete